MASTLPEHGGRLRTDKEHEAIGSLEATARFLESVQSDPDMWKWVIVALHNAVQGFMVIALNGTEGWGALTDKDIAIKVKAQQDFWKAKAAGNNAAAEEANDIMLWNPPKQPASLARFIDLYKRIKRDEWPMIQGGTSKAFKPRKTDDRCMNDLNRIRSDFAHFLPAMRSYLLSQFPALAATGLHIIDFLVNHSGNIHLDHGSKGDAPKRRYDTAMKQAKEALARITTEYDGYPLIVKPACGSMPVPPP